MTLKNSQLVKEYDKGGIKALDFESMVGTLRLNGWKHICHSQILCGFIFQGPYLKA